jgi:hypothetical protein
LIFGKWVTTFWKTFGQVSVMLENDGRHPALASRLRMAISSKEHGALLNACKNFEESLKGFIRNPKAGGAAQVAAQCLFEVRKLENTLCRKMTKGTAVKIVPPVNKKDSWIAPEKCYRPPWSELTCATTPNIKRG